MLPGLTHRGPGVALGYRANLWLRSAVRVLQLVAEGQLNPDAPGGEVRTHQTSASSPPCHPSLKPLRHESTGNYELQSDPSR